MSDRPRISRFDKLLALALRSNQEFTVPAAEEKKMKITNLDAAIADGLQQRGLSAAELAWVCPIKTAVLRSKQQWHGGFCAMTRSRSIHLFPPAGIAPLKIAVNLYQKIQRRISDQNASSEVEDASLAGVPASNIQWLIRPVSGAPQFSMVFDAGTAFESVELSVNEAGAQSGFGNWLSEWERAAQIALGVSPSPKKIGLVSFSRHRLTENAFGIQTAQESGIRVSCFHAGELKTLPPLDLPPLSVRKWQRTESGVSLLIDHQGFPEIIDLKEWVFDGKRPCSDALTAELTSGPAEGVSLKDELSALGIFDAKIQGAANFQKWLVRQNPGGLSLVSHDGTQQMFAKGFAHDNVVTLSADDGAFAQIRGLGEQQGKILSSLGSPAKGRTTEKGAYWCVALQDRQNSLAPTKLSLTDDAVVLDAGYRLPIETDGQFEVAALSDGNCALTFSPASSSQEPLRFIVPEALAHNLWEEWEMRRTTAKAAKASLADLYKQFNDVKKSTLLLALFSDVILLNRKLNENGSMDALIEQLNSQSAADFAKDEKAKQLTVSKILPLVLILPQIKRKFELLASMYPYYCAHEDSQWLQTAFSLRPNDPVIETGNRQMVPVIRREVRSIQGNMQRALMEIEVSAHSLDAILAKGEIQQHWEYKLRKYVPTTLQGIFAAGLVTLSGGANPVAWNMLGNFLAAGVLGSICSKILDNAEATSQIQRAARTIFPWWQVFMQTLVVSIYEAGQFIDGQNIAAMQRDRALLDRAPASDRAETIHRMQITLRQRIIDQKRNRFTEIFEGSSIRMETIASDIQLAISESMTQEIATFVEGINSVRTQ